MVFFLSRCYKEYIGIAVVAHGMQYIYQKTPTREKGGFAGRGRKRRVCTGRIVAAFSGTCVCALFSPPAFFLLFSNRKKLMFWGGLSA